MERNDSHEDRAVAVGGGRICKFYDDDHDDGWEHCINCGGVFRTDGDHYSHWCKEVGDYVDEYGQIIG